MKTLVSMVLLLAPASPIYAALIFPDCCSDGPVEKVESAVPQAACQAALSSTLFNLAADARLKSRMPEAETLYNRVVALREALSGQDSPDLGRPLAGLALVYLSEGRLSLAMETADRAVRVTAARPDDILRTAHAENAFATVLMARGDAARAETLERKVADGLNRANATASQEYVDALANLGTSRLRLAKYHQAELDLREAEAAALKVAGPHHPSTATIWNNLAKTRAAQGDWKDAERLFQKALAVWRATPGPDFASGLSNLAALYQSRKRYSEAHGLFAEALAIDAAALGADSLKVANDWDNLGALAAAQRHYGDAERAVEKALAIADNKVGFAHPDTAGIAVNLAVVYYSEAKYAEASNLFAKALPVKEQMLGPDSGELAVLLRLYARSLKSAHDYAAAEKVELQATRIVTHNALD